MKDCLISCPSRAALIVQGDTVRSPWDIRYNQGLSWETGAHARPTGPASPVVWSPRPRRVWRVRCLLGTSGAQRETTGPFDTEIPCQCCVIRVCIDFFFYQNFQAF